MGKMEWVMKVLSFYICDDPAAVYDFQAHPHIETFSSLIVVVFPSPRNRSRL